MLKIINIHFLYVLNQIKKYTNLFPKEEKFLKKLFLRNLHTFIYLKDETNKTITVNVIRNEMNKDMKYFGCKIVVF